MNEGIITIDGPAGSGKSSVARRLAEALQMDFLDTGAMYRAVAAASLDRGFNPDDQREVAGILGLLNIDFDWTKNPPAIMVDHHDYSTRIRDNEVSGFASVVAAYPEVRRFLVASQQRIGMEHPRLVTEGRDQGSVVFPEAVVKFYLDASPEIRAERRAKELKEKGQDVDLHQLIEEIKQRDHRDMNRDDSPLVVPDGAIIVDTSHMRFDEVLNQLTRQSESYLK